jgi:hypothetical protein
VRARCADPDLFDVTGLALVPDVDVVTAAGEIRSRAAAKSDVGITGAIVQRLNANRGIIVTSGIVVECERAVAVLL